MDKITQILEDVVRCKHFEAGVHIKNPMKNSYQVICRFLTLGTQVSRKLSLEARHVQEHHEEIDAHMMMTREFS
jgi:hypothetical protein